jgi:hypothetical protein
MKGVFFAAGVERVGRYDGPGFMRTAAWSGARTGEKRKAVAARS